MNKSESKYFNTALLMDEALLKLLEAKDFEYITVKEICEKAGVNRSTFYLHYETVADLLAECLEYTNKQFLSAFTVEPEAFLSEIGSAPLNELILIKEKFLRPYLTFLAEHRSVFRAAYKNPSSMQTNERFRDVSENILRPIMKRFQVPEKEQSYWIAFYIHGCTAIIQEWFKGNCKESVEEIETVMLNCIRPENGLLGNRYGE